MPSAYLVEDDKAAYGVPAATAQQITRASVLIDAYLNRPEGVIFVPTASGLPGYMLAKQPTTTLTAPGAIAAGSNVVVNVTGAVTSITVGTPLVIDRATAASVDVSIVTAINGTQITLDTVEHSHDAGVKLEAGLVIAETNQLPNGRPLTILAKTPIARVLSGQGRYGFGRRGDRWGGQMNDFNLLAAVSNFGGPPAWEPFTLNASGIDPETGQIWVPSGVLLAYYTEVRINYVAGWTYAAMPDAIRLACAQLIGIIANYPEFQGGNVSMISAGDHKIQRFAATVMDADLRLSLDSFRARLYA